MLSSILQGKILMNSRKKDNVAPKPILKEEKKDPKKDKVKTVIIPTGDPHRDFRNYAIKEKPSKMELIEKLEKIIKDEEEADMK